MFCTRQVKGMCAASNKKLNEADSGWVQQEEA